MKTFIIAIIATSVILSGIFVYIFYMNHTMETFLSLTNAVAEYAQKEEWNQCHQTVKQLEQEWSKRKNLLCAFTDHGDLDKMEQELYEMSKCVFYQNEEDVVRCATILASIIERVKDNESITWENILKTYTKNVFSA